MLPAAHDPDDAEARRLLGLPTSLLRPAMDTTLVRARIVQSPIRSTDMAPTIISPAPINDGHPIMAFTLLLSPHRGRAQKRPCRAGTAYLFVALSRRSGRWASSPP